MIIPVYKPLGASTHQLAKKAGEMHGEKATHTGTLDPMAEGVVVVLSGEDRFKKAEMSGGKKTYVFEMMVGVSTDTQDLLGLITNTDNLEEKAEELEEKIKQVIHGFIGPQKQAQPEFSAKRIAGESYFDKAKRGENLPETSGPVHIYELHLSGARSFSKTELRNNILTKLSHVKGDFRQEEIIEGWEQYFESAPQDEFLIFELFAEVSKRTYVRSLVRDIGEKLGINTATYSIIRTQNGPYTIADCICLV